MVQLPFFVCLTARSFCLMAALRGQIALRNWASASQGSHGGMCSDSESAGGSSESRSMDSPTASPGGNKPFFMKLSLCCKLFLPMNTLTCSCPKTLTPKC